MSLVVPIIVTVLLVLGVGLLIFFLMRRSQTVVPDVADREASRHERVVALDDDGRPVTESQEEDPASRDGGAFESVLKEELEDLGR